MYDKTRSVPKWPNAQTRVESGWHVYSCGGQAGFGSGSSCTGQVLALTSNIEAGFRHAQKTGLVLINLSILGLWHSRDVDCCWKSPGSRSVKLLCTACHPSSALTDLGSSLHVGTSPALSGSLTTASPRAPSWLPSSSTSKALYQQPSPRSLSTALALACQRTSLEDMPQSHGGVLHPLEIMLKWQLLLSILVFSPMPNSKCRLVASWWGMWSF